MGTVTDLPTKYRYRLPLTVVAHAEDDTHGRYRPTPQQSWTGTQAMSWMVGVVALELDVPVVVRKTYPGDLIAVGQFSLKIGDRQPITGLSAERVMDILGGCMTAIDLLERS